MGVKVWLENESRQPLNSNAVILVRLQKLLGINEFKFDEDDGHLELLSTGFICLTFFKESMMAEWRFQVPRHPRRRHRHDCLSARVRDECDAEGMTTIRCLMILRFRQAAV